MLKFYYSGAPNPMKVALFLEEAELPCRPAFIFLLGEARTRSST